MITEDYVNFKIVKRLKVVVVMVLALLSCCGNGESSEKIKEVVLMDPMCDGVEEGDYEWGYMVKERKRCSRRMEREFFDMLREKGNMYLWDESVVCYCTFLPDVYVKCDGMDVFIEFRTLELVIKYEDEGSYDYVLSEEGYRKMLDWCIRLFPCDKVLNEYLKL